MLSIGIFTYSSKPRGSVVHAAALAEALCALGHHATLYALSKPGEGFYRPLRCPLRLLPAEPAPAAMDLLVRQRIEEFTRGLRAIPGEHDLYHAEDCLSANALLGADIAPVVRTVHHVDRFESVYLRECQRRSIEQAALLFSVSSFTQGEVKEFFARQAVLVQNAVDPTRFASAPRVSARELASRFGIQEQDRVVLSVGGVEPRKNSLSQLAAVARAHESDSRIRFVIVGGASIFEHASYRAEFDARLAELPVELRERVVCTGPLTENELTALYRRSDVLLCASRLEGFGLCVLEALAAGTPAVVSREPPFTEYLDERTACFVDPGSVESIAEGLKRTLCDGPFAARLRANGLRLSAQFCWSAVAEAHVLHYRALLAGRPPALAALAPS
ncbi:MAG TPA: MSMEG_0565 family glycosyltransferase [Polyangiaceae bacterium]|nr:MSMEG_0565 family glycosyltransferase [Polyangiaceae bacterium]